MEKTYNYLRIYNDIKSAILTNQYRKGDKLPAEGQLQSTYGVSRITVKKAMEMLSEDGFIERYPGKGTFVLHCGEETVPAGDSSSKSGVQNAIAVVMSSFGPYFGQGFLEGVAEEANRHGLSLLAGLCYSTLEEEAQLIQRQIACGAKGIIVMPIHSESGINAGVIKAAMEKYPIVMADRYLEGFQLPYVGTDHTQAAFYATQYLFSLGHKNIGLVSSAPTTTAITERENGYLKAYAMTKYQVHSEYMISDIKSSMPGLNTAEKFRADVERMKQFYRENPSVTALLCIDYGVMKICETAAREAGIRIPADMSLVCFDAPNGGFVEFEYTHICQPEREIGVTAVQMLMDVIQGNHEPKRTLLPAELRIGMSTGKPRE